MNNQNIENEIKFLLSRQRAEEIREMLRKLSRKDDPLKVYEKTAMFDNAEGIMQKEDARLRVRQVGLAGSKPQIEFSYKRRLTTDNTIKKEEEIECAFSSDIKNFISIINKMGFSMTTSYERYRTTFLLNQLKITLDEFPFGDILEIEGNEAGIMSMCTSLGLDPSMSTLESCDDVYVRLCQEQGVKSKDHILFSDDPMPIFK